MDDLFRWKKQRVAKEKKMPPGDPEKEKVVGTAAEKDLKKTQSEKELESMIE